MSLESVGQHKLELGLDLKGVTSDPTMIFTWFASLPASLPVCLEHKFRTKI